MQKSPDGKIHKKIDHVLSDRRWHSNTLELWFLRGVDCNTDHYLMLAILRERLSGSKILADASKEDGLEVYTDQSKDTSMFHYENERQNHNIKIHSKSF